MSLVYEYQTDSDLAHCASDATVFKTTSCMLHPRPNTTSEILETDKGVAEKIKLVPLPGTRMFREWVCNQIRNSGVPEYYVGKISKLFLDESRPRVSAEGLLEDALDQRNYLARLFLDSRLKAKLEKEIKRAEKEMLKSVKAKADENVVNNKAREDDIFRRARVKSDDKMFDDLKQKMKAEEAQQEMKAEEAQQKVKAEEAQQKVKAEEAQQKMKAEEAQQKVKAEEAQQKMKAEEAKQKMKAEEAQQKMKAEAATSVPIGRGLRQNPSTRRLPSEIEGEMEDEIQGLREFSERLNSICEIFEQFMDEDEKTRMDFIENADMQINCLCFKILIDSLADKTRSRNQRPLGRWCVAPLPAWTRYSNGTGGAGMNINSSLFI